MYIIGRKMAQAVRCLLGAGLLLAGTVPCPAVEVTWNTTDVTNKPFPPVTYVCRSGAVIRDGTTNRIVLHVVRVDLAAPGVGIRARVQPPTRRGFECRTETTLDAVTRCGAQIGINGNFFVGESGGKENDGNLCGMAVDQGTRYSPADGKWYGVNFGPDNAVTFFEPADTNGATLPAIEPYNVVSSQPVWLIRNGVPRSRPADGGKLNPMTSFGLTTNRVLVLLLCDGRDPSWSDGTTSGELAYQLGREGCVDAIAMDGGGSTTLVLADPAPHVVNRVSDRFLGVFPQPRAVGNSLLITIGGTTDAGVEF